MNELCLNPHVILINFINVKFSPVNKMELPNATQKPFRQTLDNENVNFINYVD